MGLRSTLLRLGLSQVTARLSPEPEGQPPRTGRFNQLIDALNRLPRLFLAMGTPGLLIYAMADPEGFSIRMRALALVPEPLWWLLGAVVTFYFGAREAHYRRERAPLPPQPPENPALDDWHRSQDPLP